MHGGPMADIILLSKGETISLVQWHGDGIWALTISGYDGLCDYLTKDDLLEMARRITEAANK